MKPAPRKLLPLFALVLIGAVPVHAVQNRPAAELEYDKALAAISSGSYGDAVEILDSLVDEQPYNASYLFDLGRARAANEDLDQAVDTFKTLLQLDPNHKLAAVALAQLHDRRGEWPEVVRLLSPISETSAMFEVSHLLAEAHRNLRALEDAAWHYERAVRIDPQAQDDFVWLGSLYMERDLSALAIRAFESAVELGHRSARTHYQLARAYHRIGLSLGRIEVRPLRDAQPGMTHGEWYVLEPLADRPNRFRVTGSNSAIYHLQKAIELGLDEPGMHLFQADIWLSAKHYERAKKQYASIEDRVAFEDLAGFHYRYGLTLFGLGDVKAFQTHLDRALELDRASYKPKLQEAYTTVAEHYCLRGNLDKYIYYLERAIDEAPRSVALRYRLTNALIEAGHRAEAVVHGRVVLQLDPYHVDSQRMLELVNDRSVDDPSRALTGQSGVIP